MLGHTRTLLLLTAGLAAACAGPDPDDDGSASIAVRLSGPHPAAYRLTGPADHVEVVVDDLLVTLAAADPMSLGDGSALVASEQERREVPLAEGVDGATVTAVARAHGFSVVEEQAAPDAGGKADSFGTPADRKRIAGAEVANYSGFLPDSFANFRPATGQWTLNMHDSDGRGETATRVWGQLGDKPVLGDFDCDGRTDVTVWRPGDGNWFVWTMKGARWRTQWGQAGDIPTPGDFDRDGCTDYAIYRPSTRTFWMLEADGKQWAFTVPDSGSNWPAPGDYDGDGMTDLAWSYGDGLFKARLTSTNAVRSYPQNLYGAWWPIPGDYDRDGKTDPGYYVRGYFYIYESSRNYAPGPEGDINAGSRTAIAVAGDYDGDRRMDYTIFEPGTATYIVQRHDGSSFKRVVGQPGDVAVTGYDRWDDGTLIR